jgi:hypothetical protein
MKRKRAPRRTKWRWKITDEQYLTLHSVQRGLCTVCNEAPIFGGLQPVIDYVAGKIFGLACRRCSVGLDALRLNPELCARALTFLQQTGLPVENVA